MQANHTSKMITAGVLFLFLCSSLCMGLPWAAQAQGTIVKVEPYRFNDIFDDFLSNFQTNFPEKPPSPPKKDEFETTREYEVRRSTWEKEHEKAVTSYREKFSKTVPVFELYDVEFIFGRYNADKGCFRKIKSSRFNVVDVYPVCEGYQIDASCHFGPLDRYAEIIANNICIKKEKAKALKAITSQLRMRVGFQPIPPFPKDSQGKLKFHFHHVSIYDTTTGKTLLTVTDQPLRGIKHGD
jgi:hypothetical protein